MTYAYLPAPSVVEACRGVKVGLEKRREFERATEPDPLGVAERESLERDDARVEGIMALARAAGEGTIAVDTDDFQMIASHYQV